MKNKIIALAAIAGTAVIGNSLFSAPVHALDVNQDVDVEINVPEVLYLRTFDTVSLNITEADLGGGTAATTGGVGSDYETNGTPAGTTDGTTAIDPTSPFAGVTGGSIIRNVQQLYAVWSNSANAVTINHTIPTPALTNGTATATIKSVNNTTGSGNNPPGLITPLIGGVDIEFDLTNATTAGTYTGGVINVEAITGI